MSAIVFVIFVFAAAVANNENTEVTTYKTKHEIFMAQMPDGRYIPAKFSQEWEEEWHVSGVTDPEEDPNYTTTKQELYSERPFVFVEKEGPLERTVRQGEQILTFKFGMHPGMMFHGDKTFGSVRLGPPGGPNWPLFISVERVTGSLYRATWKTFLSDGRVKVLRYTFTRSAHHLPLEVVEETTLGTGEVIYRVTKTRR